MIWIIVIAIVAFLAYKFIKAGTPEGTIKATEHSYWKLKRNNPGLDEHQYLLSVYAARRNLQNKLNVNNYKNINDLIDNYSASKIVKFAILPPPESIRALALHIAMYENTEKLKYMNDIIDEFNSIMTPVDNLFESNPDKFVQIYKDKNPNMTTHINIEKYLNN